MKKLVVFLLLFVALIQFSSAIELDISKSAVQNVVVRELEEPALFNVTVKNLGSADTFHIYSLVGVKLEPENIYLGSGEEKNFLLKVYPEKPIKESVTGTYSFVYKFRNSKDEILEDSLAIEIRPLASIFEIRTDEITPESSRVNLYVRNKKGITFDNIKAKFSSVFFETERSFALLPYETKVFSIALDKERLKNVIAGDYMLRTELTIKNTKAVIESVIKFSAKPELETKESVSGFLIYFHRIERKNNGNTISQTTITVTKNIFSRIFTTFSTYPDKVVKQGIWLRYVWTKELKPGESFTLTVTTNYLLPILFLLVLSLAFYLARKNLASAVIVTKRVRQVRTKNNLPALKVFLSVKAVKRVENVKLLDKIPQMMKVYERFGLVEPSRIDEKNRVLEWQIGDMEANDERAFSYVIYSKIGIIGKLQMPRATAIYEQDGRIRESVSNIVTIIFGK